jgi:hypothetical protein
VEILRWLTHRRIASAQEVIVSRMDVQRAIFARDALAKRLYGELFAWLVHAVNRALDTGHAKKHFIGKRLEVFHAVLDCIITLATRKNILLVIVLKWFLLFLIAK